MIKDEIKKLFANSDINSAYRIESAGDRYVAYVVRFYDSLGVAVPYGGDDFSEDFANVSVFTGTMNSSGISKRCLFLTSSAESTRNEFAVFCEIFVDPGENGSKRAELLKDPSSWWTNWKTLIGNRISEKKPYAVLGELLVYEYLLNDGKKVKWGGPESSSHDIISDGTDYEVKSTTSRYDKKIHIAGQFQLQSDKKLFLVFCRFEENINGICINDMVDRLVENCGELRDEINAKLSKQGYVPGNSARKEKYQIHESVMYEVNEEFPHITPQSFVGGMLPKGITKLEYDVDLSVLDGKRFH